MNLFHTISNTLLVVFLTFHLSGHIVSHSVGTAALALPQSGGGTVSPEFQCYRLCYPWKMECNSISYLVEESPTCWRCCLIPTNATTTTTTTTCTATTAVAATETVKAS